jgi:hypothetical protein
MSLLPARACEPDHSRRRGAHLLARTRTTRHGQRVGAAMGRRSPGLDAGPAASPSPGFVIGPGQTCEPDADQRGFIFARAGDVELPTQRAHAVAAADGGATVELGFAELNMAPSGRHGLVVSEGRPSSCAGRWAEATIPDSSSRGAWEWTHRGASSCRSEANGRTSRPGPGCANRRCEARVTPQARRQSPPTPDHSMCTCIAPRRPRHHRQRRRDRDPHLRAPRPASAQARFRKR